MKNKLRELLYTIQKAVGICLFFFLHLQPAFGQETKHVNAMPAIVSSAAGGYSLLVDGKPFIILGAQLWNSSSWPYILDKVWPQLRELHCNTLEAPIYWQNIEPEPGKYNFKELDSLVLGARSEHLHLILLWFGSYKNGSSEYIPDWMMSQSDKYPRVQNEEGREMQILSPVAPSNIAADKAAFSAVMKHIRQIDGIQHTVLLMQVENECGSLGTDRDYCPAANVLFRQMVPAALTAKLGKKQGTWEDVFGIRAAESFNAYYFATYINEVALAGKKEYSLPMYTNNWLREHRFRRPGEFPSGGPATDVLDIWKQAAPQLNFLAPDIYIGNYDFFVHICTEFDRPDNPFFIPEMAKGVEFARFQFYALGNFDAMGIAPYGIDPFHVDPNDQRSPDRLDDKFHLFADNYRLLGGALGKIAALQASGNLQAAGEEYGMIDQLLAMGNYDVLFSYGYPKYSLPTPHTGRVLIGQLDSNEFLVVGFDARFQFRPTYGSGYTSAEFISIEEGYYENDTWIRQRIWNGDEAYHCTLTDKGNILKIKLRRSTGLKANGN